MHGSLAILRYPPPLISKVLVLSKVIANQSATFCQERFLVLKLGPGPLSEHILQHVRPEALDDLFAQFMCKLIIERAVRCPVARIPVPRRPQEPFPAFFE